jgi:uncharacterized protein
MAFINAVKQGHVEVVQELIKAGVNVNAPNKSGNTALRYAAERGHAHIVEFFIGIGIDKNMQDFFGQTAFMKAALFKRTRIVHEFIAASADINAQYENYSTALMHAACEDYVEMTELLCHKCANAYFCNYNGETAYDLAYKKKHEKIVEILKKHERSYDLDLGSKFAG